MIATNILLFQNFLFELAFCLDRSSSRPSNLFKNPKGEGDVAVPPVFQEVPISRVLVQLGQAPPRELHEQVLELNNPYSPAQASLIDKVTQRH
jgi:hypothetical protein